MKRTLATLAILLFSMSAEEQPAPATSINIWQGVVRKAEIYKHDVSVHEILTMEMDIRQKEDPAWRLILKIWLGRPEGLTKLVDQDVEIKTTRNPYDPQDTQERVDSCGVGNNGEPCRLEKLESVRVIE